MDKFDAQLGARLIDDIVLLLPSGGAIAPEDNPPLPIDSFVYLDLYFGYTVNDNLKVSRNSVEAYLAGAYGESQQRAEFADPSIVTLLVDDGRGLVAFSQLRRGPAPPCVRFPSPVEVWRF